MTKKPVGEVRAWARQQGFELGDRGRLPAEVWEAWERRDAAHSVSRPGSQVVEPAGTTAEDLELAQQRIAGLEQQLSELTLRVVQLESRVAEPRRLFARSR